MKCFIMLSYFIFVLSSLHGLMVLFHVCLIRRHQLLSDMSVS